MKTAAFIIVIFATIGALTVGRFIGNLLAELTGNGDDRG